MSTISNVAILGASGSLGTPILSGLISSAKFNVTVLRRKGSPSTFASGVKVVDVDLDSVDDLTAALRGQDAVVSTVGSAAIGVQKTLVDAAVAAGVKRILPSEFGSDLDNPRARKLPVFAFKVEVQDYIIAKSATSDLTYTLVYNSAFLDWGLEHNFIFRHAGYKPSLIDGGDAVFSATTLASVADAVVGVLSHPDETRNRAVYIEDTKLTQKKLLDLARKVAPSKPWDPQTVALDDLTSAADERLAKGLLDSETFIPYLYRAVLDPEYGGNFAKTDNQLLGVKGYSDEAIEELLKKLIK